MGYPMTWQRVVNRNGLADGSYDAVPAAWAPGNVEKNVHAQAVSSVLEWRRERLEALAHKARMLAGDLRRLELDSVDEGATCKEIARRTGIDVDTVAAVLKEFMSW
jgi:DNA-binding NarL/FixJ family response regulator